MIQEQIVTINRITAKHEYTFSAALYTVHVMTVQWANTQYQLAQYSLGMSNTFFMARSSGPKEVGSSSSTVIFRYEPSGFDRYTSQFGPNWKKKKKEIEEVIKSSPFSLFAQCFVCGPDNNKKVNKKLDLFFICRSWLIYNQVQMTQL